MIIILIVIKILIMMMKKVVMRMLQITMSTQEKKYIDCKGDYNDVDEDN